MPTKFGSTVVVAVQQHSLCELFDAICHDRTSQIKSKSGSGVRQQNGQLVDNVSIDD